MPTSTLRALLAITLLAGALALPTVVSCAGSEVREASAQVEHLKDQLTTSLDNLAAAQAALRSAQLAPAGSSSPEQLAALEANSAALQETVDALGGALKAALEDLPAAWKRDIEGIDKDEMIGGALTLGGAQGGAVGIASTLLLSLWRDRRKKKGRDPLQRGDVYTPATRTIYQDEPKFEGPTA